MSLILNCSDRNKTKYLDSGSTGYSRSLFDQRHTHACVLNPNTRNQITLLIQYFVLFKSESKGISNQHLKYHIKINIDLAHFLH